ncbi:FliC/FljB family flagellin [Enterobacter sp. R1(2018)]|uniref:FliC/FljB family flagellin n=1 Tax=Enterobacter sp. R1(2018) TaxID=2447891 RepID=UPI000EAE07F2|nr:FliC/FljB family flagellin [Enterobacter sp. R1(2018)]RKQ38284.1 FliC/FljB family flagellin [Enterobacter sp. R1(2018)]
MAQVINTNSLSLITQNNINKNQSAMSTAIERLSSGLRINSAKDDAAGQAIANRFTSNIKGLTQAARNANDGISLAQTTEGALSEINNNLQRVRELTVQATTGTNSSSDLDSIQDEIKSRLDEIDRVSGQTQFNGVNVLSKDGSMKIQVGANDGETITIDLKEITSDTLGLKGFNVNGKGEVANKAATTDSLTLSGFKAGATPAADGTVTYSKDVDYAKATASNVLATAKNGDEITFAGNNGTGIAATGGTYKYDKASDSYSFSATAASKDNLLNNLAPNAGDSFSAKVTIGGKSQDVNVSKDGTITSADGKALYLDQKGNLTQTGSGTTVAATWDNLMANTDTSGKDAYGNTAAAAVATKIEAKGVTINSAGGSAQVATDAAYNTAYDAAITATPGDTAGAAAAAAAARTTAAATAVDTTTADVSGVSISSAQMANILKDKDFSLGDGTTTYAVTSGAVTVNGDAAYVNDNGAISDEASETVNYYAHTNGSITNNTGSTIYSTADGKLTTDATTASTSTADPLKALTDAISQIDKFRSSLGAVQNRLDSAVTNLNNTTTNLSAAQSRIQDADYATEVSNMSKAQIIQQAGNSVLAKANQVPQQVLSLLQG